MRLKLFESEGFFYRPIRAHRIKICACRFNIRANLIRTNLKAISISAIALKFMHVASICVHFASRFVLILDAQI